jgi:hypothetical protein
MSDDNDPDESESYRIVTPDDLLSDRLHAFNDRLGDPADDDSASDGLVDIDTDSFISPTDPDDLLNFGTERGVFRVKCSECDRPEAVVSPQHAQAWIVLHMIREHRDTLPAPEGTGPRPHE